MVNPNFPKAYINTVSGEGKDPMIEYTHFDKLDIGARKSGQPANNLNGIKSLEHVGKSAGRKGVTNG